MNARTAEYILIGALLVNVGNVALFATPMSPYILTVMVAVAVAWRVYIAWANLQTIAKAGAWMVGHAFAEHYPTRFKWYLSLMMDTWTMLVALFIASAYLVDWLFWPMVVACAVTAFPIGGFVFCWELYERTVTEAQAELDAENDR